MTSNPATAAGTVAEALGWAPLCAASTGIAGFVGHLVGGRLYPQVYEQIPSDFFFVPLGIVVGFVAAATARTAAAGWSAGAMLAFVALVTTAYGGVMFQYSRTHAVAAHVVVSSDSAAPAAAGCTPDTCSDTDPPSQWVVTGNLHIVETSGLGVTVDAIEITSTPEEPAGPARPHPYSKEGAALAAKWRGPLVMLSGRHLGGPRHLGPNQTGTYRIRYNYHAQDAASRRKVMFFLHLTDGAGRPTFGNLTWHVQ